MAQEPGTARLQQLALWRGLSHHAQWRNGSGAASDAVGRLEPLPASCRESAAAFAFEGTSMPGPRTIAVLGSATALSASMPGFEVLGISPQPLEQVLQAILSRRFGRSQARYLGNKDTLRTDRHTHTPGAGRTPTLQRARVRQESRAKPTRAIKSTWMTHIPTSAR